MNDKEDPFKYTFYDVDGNEFDHEDEAIRYAEVTLGWLKEWRIEKHEVTVIDQNYTNYN